MSENKETTFEDAVDWATSDKDSKCSRKKSGIPLVYLILGAVVIFALIILIIYLISRDPSKIDALRMMQDEQYTYGGEYEEEYVMDGDYDGEYDSGYVDVDYQGNYQEYDQGYDYVDEYIDPTSPGIVNTTNLPLTSPLPNTPVTNI